MATGDQADIQARIYALLPQSWFASETPVLDALIAGCANALAFAYSLISYVQNQTRIKTATDGFLDLISQDYFGGRLPRNSGESDSAFRARILANLFVEKGTRAGMIATLTVLTGRAPRVVEPIRPPDTGAYGGPYGGYGVSGAYSNPALVPYQGLVTAYRGNGVADADIYAAVEGAKPEGTVVWTRISN